MNWLLRCWRLWALALGEKASSHNKEADAIALIRTMIVMVAVITNIMITLNIIVRWDK